ncbi:dihydrolipoyl dehydrogenase [Natranaerobius thermophilus]|uniref:Dihydrolipoyl dehydrogenase n=1 Tax=Natranaerobius thermophilus (strain ATCC BAA-1301 / DSM 18059 / JW/NM-WN-LF) TaxID=457570 RepID=B2A7X4_NATTJ|nr:dihydrolipoyl dehydrogenase [Natranaerobius thermophilus]ACB85746.1 dihydrolipoamide dehydrogenase [Natranaerobius thermophilus JW/NM-WN-LF]
MDFLVKIPKLNQKSNQVTVYQWFIQEGEEVKSGDPLLEVTSDKTNVRVEAEVNGTVKEIMVSEGEKAKLNQAVCKLETTETVSKDKPKSSPKDKDTSKTSGSDESQFNYFGSLLGKKEPEKESKEVDLCILGGGPGGYTAAIRAAKAGLSVALVEKDNLGGTCLNRGCIPTKALIQSANLLSQINSAENFGITTDAVIGDFSKAVSYKDNVVTTLKDGVANLLANNQVSVISGEGQLKSSTEVTVEADNKIVNITAKNIILATGSKPKLPPIEGIEHENVLTSTELLNLKELPSKMVIIGGGVIGMELSFILNKFGVDVTVVEAMDHILPYMDKQIGEEIKISAEEQGINIITGAFAKEISQVENGGLMITLTKNEEQLKVFGNQILVAIGRDFNTKALNATELGLDTTKQGAIQVDKHLKTSLDNVYAIGDVIGGYLLAHEASHEAIVAVDNILGIEKQINYDNIPSAVFTDPEAAQVGLTQKEAKDMGYQVKTAEFPFSSNGKVLTTQKLSGFSKLVVNSTDNVILGGSLVGVGATELIHQIAIAVTNQLTVEQLTNTVFAHPTVSETIFESSLAFFGEEIHG